MRAFQKVPFVSTAPEFRILVSGFRKRGLRTSALHINGEPLVGLHPADNPYLLPAPLEDGPLLDVQLKVRGHGRRGVARGDGAEVADALELRLERRAAGAYLGEGVGLFRGDGAGPDAGGEHAYGEASAFLTRGMACQSLFFFCVVRVREGSLTLSSSLRPPGEKSRPGSPAAPSASRCPP